MKRNLLAPIITLVLVGCGSAAGSASPTDPPTEGFRLRVWSTQALPPAGAFATSGDDLGIADGRLIVHGPQIELFPGPLLPNIQSSPISAAGMAAIIDAARQTGLLDGPTDLTGGQMPPGSQTGHLLFVIGGVEREVLGDPTRQIVCITTPCDAAPGTPEAFGSFWARIHGIAEQLGGEVGAASPYVPAKLAVLLAKPEIDPDNEPPIVMWPLETAMSQFGVPFFGSDVDRCGVIEGADLQTFMAALGRANELTHVTDGVDAIYRLVARPLFPGEPSPCGGS
jgi:hypothetical protein